MHATKKEIEVAPNFETRRANKRQYFRRRFQFETRELLEDLSLIIIIVLFLRIALHVRRYYCILEENLDCFQTRTCPVVVMRMAPTAQHYFKIEHHDIPTKRQRW
jgi:hypothetical protein